MQQDNALDFAWLGIIFGFQNGNVNENIRTRPQVTKPCMRNILQTQLYVNIKKKHLPNYYAAGNVRKGEQVLQLLQMIREKYCC